MHVVRAAAVLLAATLGASALRASPPTPLGHAQNLRGRDTCTVKAGSYTVRVTARVAAHGPAESTAPPWGADDKLDTTWRLITSLEIWHGKARIDVPRSAFADLANGNSIEVRNDVHGCVITMMGGDAGCAWKADIWANAKRVTRRTVRSGEFPDNAWEETRYVEHFPSGM
jgi:hypothetical protein